MFNIEFTSMLHLYHCLMYATPKYIPRREIYSRLRNGFQVLREKKGEQKRKRIKGVEKAPCSENWSNTYDVIKILGYNPILKLLEMLRALPNVSSTRRL